MSASPRCVALFVLTSLLAGATSPARTPAQAPAPQEQGNQPQEAKHIAYAQRDLLTPFRSPTDAYAPPDELFGILRAMQTIADATGAKKSFDADGREVIDDENWRLLRAELAKKGLDAGYLAQIMRLNRNAPDRATAFYAAFYVAEVDHVFNLIGHIPGEPVRRTRELAFPRAIAFLQANLSRRFGDLSKEQKERITNALPEPGSPVAKARGIVRGPRDEDYLHQGLTLVPFFQLLDVDAAIDQAQAAWFLKEAFLARKDLALQWLEPALPRVKQLLRSDSAPVREQAIGLLQAIAPKDLRQPPAGDPKDLIAWADEAAKDLFPPIRNVNDTIVQLFPSPERDAIAAAGEAALRKATIGDPVNGQRKDGTHYRGFRIALVPDELKALAIPTEAVITTVNGAPVSDAASVLEAVRRQLASKASPRKLFVEYVLGGEQHAIEYRVM